MEPGTAAGFDGDSSWSNDERGSSSHPQAWTPIGENCWRRGDHTIVRYGTERGWRFELWHLKEQGMGNFKSFEATAAHHEVSIT